MNTIPVEIFFYTHAKLDYGIVFVGWSYCIVRDGQILKEKMGGCSGKNIDYHEMNLKILANVLEESKNHISRLNDYVKVKVSSKYIMNVYLKEYWKQWKGRKWGEVKHPEQWIRILPFFKNNRYTFVGAETRNEFFYKCLNEAKKASEIFRREWKGIPDEREFR